MLQGLEPAAPVAVSLENVEVLVGVILRDVTLAVEGMKGSALLFESAWRRIVLEVAKGQTATMQSARPQLLSALERRLGLLKEAHEMSMWLRGLRRADSLAPDALLPEITGLERLKANVFDRWETADDLEDLAARDYPLTTADLDRAGPHRRPPASYYAEESKPF